MKRFLICTFAAAVIAISLACCGVSEAEAGQEEMFVEVYVVGDVDFGAVFTVLVNPDCTPMIWEE